MSSEKIGLPSMEYTFSISVQGDETKRYYDGQFTYKRPTLHEKAEIAKMKTRLNGDLKTLSLDVQMFNEMSSTLFYCIKDAPDWWATTNNGRDLYDLNVIQEIFTKSMDFEDEWSKKVWGEKKEDVVLNKAQPKE